MRLYRGLDRPYRPDRVVPNAGTFITTDFTDCVFTALQFARGRRGVVLVLDVPETGAKVSEEYWPGTQAKRFMYWGRFAQHITLVFEAKELRAQIRAKGVAGLSDEVRAAILNRWVEREVAARCGSTASPEGHQR